MKQKRYLKTSNIVLMAGGLLLVVLLLASIISARIVFDKTTLIQSPQDKIIVLDSNF